MVQIDKIKKRITLVIVFMTVLLLFGCGAIRQRSIGTQTAQGTEEPLISRLEVVSASKNDEGVYCIQYPSHYYALTKEALNTKELTLLGLMQVTEPEDLPIQETQYLIDYLTALPDAEVEDGQSVSYRIFLSYVDENGSNVYLSKYGYETFPKDWDVFVDHFNEIIGQELLTKNREIETITPKFLTEKFGVTDSDVCEGTLQDVIDEEELTIASLDGDFRINDVLQRYYESVKEPLLSVHRPKELVKEESTEEEYEQFLADFFNKIGFDLSMERESDQEYFRLFENTETSSRFYTARTCDLDKLPTVKDPIEEYYQMDLDAHMEDMKCRTNFIYSANQKFILVPDWNDTDIMLTFCGENDKNNDNDRNSEAGKKQSNAEIDIVMVGDVLLHTAVSDSGKLLDGTYNYDHLFKNVKEEIESADIAIANQEVILGGTELGLSGYPAFNGAYEVGDALADAGFDVILHATNHALDKGEKGVRNCLSYWKEKHPEIEIAGINESSEQQDSKIAVIEKNGIRVAILNYTYGTNGISMPSDAPYLVNLLDKKKIEADVARAKEQSDFVILCPHWGTEYQHEPDKNQEKWASYFADLGVDLVIGTHPHVIEPTEWVKGENGNQTLVYYSLGNYVNATSGQGKGVADRMLGEMSKISLIKGTDENVKISSCSAIPLVSHLNHALQGITVYPLAEYTKELEKENEIKQQDPEFSISYLEEVWNETMQKESNFN